MDNRIKDILVNNSDVVFDYNWNKIENGNNIDFPEDYKWFLKNYGAGSINGFLWILSPNCKNLNLNSFEQYKKMKDSYDFMVQSKFIEYEYSFYNNGIGLFPWGITDNGDELFWNYMRGETEIVVFSSRYADIFTCKLNMTDFLEALLSKRIECNLFPDDFVMDNNYYDSIE